jgi:HNH endonuclease
MENDDETWLVVPGYPAYEASSLGQIRRCIASKRGPVGLIMKTQIDRWGYAKISLSRAGKYRCTQVHRVVAETFLGPPPNHPYQRYQVAHWDGDKQNNRSNNLRWATARENAQDRDRHGRPTGIQGERHHAAKLTNAQVVELRKRSDSGERGSDLAIEFGVSRPTISEIIRGKSWLKV